MSLVAGVDFGTLSVRVSIFDSERGRLGSAVSEYPLLRSKDDPDHATQRHEDHMRALVEAVHAAVAAAGVDPSAIEALAVDATASTVAPLDDKLRPIDDYYVWCDHRAHREAREITEAARAERLEAIDWCGGVYSSEWGFAKLLHWLRRTPDGLQRMATAGEHCDIAVATLCGVDDPEQMPRSICAMGHKWMWNEALGGLPPADFFGRIEPALGEAARRIRGRFAASDRVAGRLSPEWAEKLGLRAGIPIPVGGIDAHWDAVGAGIRVGDVVNVIGTSACMMAVAPEVELIPGLCGVVKGSILPDYFGLEAGLSAVGDVFDAVARRSGRSLDELSAKISDYRAGQTGLLRLAWDNGDRNVLVNPELGGVTLGWTLTHEPQDELFAAVESTAMHTRLIFERMQQYGVRIDRVIHAGGIPQKNETLNRVYANVLNKPVLVPTEPITSVGSAVFAFLAAGAFESIEQAQQALCPPYRTIDPDPAEAARYDELYEHFRRLYFALGAPDAEPAPLGEALPALRRIAAEARATTP